MAFAPVHEDDFLFFQVLDGLDGLFLDVGANIGQSARSFFAVNKSMSVLSLEPNPAVAKSLNLLKEEYPERYDFCLVGASDSPGTAILSIPQSHSVDLSENASLLPERFNFPWIKHRIESQVESVGEAPGFGMHTINVPLIAIDALSLCPLVIKFDIEGSEIRALQGAENTIREFRPIILLEVNTDFAAIVDLLRSWGFEEFRYSKSDRSLSPKPWDPRRTLNAFLLHAHMPNDLATRVRPLIRSRPGS